MAKRSHPSSKKRQKELLRLEKQRDKAARRMQRKHAGKHLDNAAPTQEDESSTLPAPVMPAAEELVALKPLCTVGA